MSYHSFDFLGWRVKVFLDRVNDDVVSGHAELFAGETGPPCRVSLITPRLTAASALVELAQRARSFIEDRTAAFESKECEDSDGLVT